MSIWISIEGEADDYERAILSEIYTNGPVTARFDLYGNFKTEYKSG